MRLFANPLGGLAKTACGVGALLLLSGACGPKDFEEASDDDDEQGAPFGDTSGLGGSMPTGGSSGAGPGCGTVTEVGVCNGTSITYCDKGELKGGDCRDLDPSCLCGMRDGVNDCICGGGAGAGGMGGTGGAGAASGSGAMAGAGARGGMAGTGGAAPNGGAAGAGPMCVGQACMVQSQCCANSQCVSFDEGAPVCAADCTRNSGCGQSGCCAFLSDFTGACGPVSACGGTGCRALGKTCDTAADCCALTGGGLARCVDFDRGGPRLCSFPCTRPADCESGCCHLDATGVQACASPEICQ